MSHTATAVQDAEQAFVDSLPTDTIEGVPVDGSGEQASEAATQPETAAPDQEGTTSTEDSFTRTDLDSLLADITDPSAKEAITRAYKGFQGDYTRKQQELADQRKALGDLDPVEAQQAVEFYTNLQTDPAFALEVHEYLSKAFEEMGLTPAQAAKAASEEITPPAVTQPVAPPVDGEDPDEYLKSQVETLSERIERFEKAEQQRASQQEEADLAARLLQQEMALRQSDKNLREEDLDRIYDLALTTGGDLFAAAKTYNDWRAEVIQSWTQQKTTVTDRVDSPAPGPAVPVRETPTDKAGNVDLEAVHKQAMQTLLNRVANGD